MTNLFKNIFIVTISLVLLLSTTILSILWSFSNNIPDYKFLKNYKPPVSSKVYSGNGPLSFGLVEAFNIYFSEIISLLFI